MNVNIDYDALFAYRFSLQEDYDLQDEKDIIIRLKYFLIDNGYATNNNIPTILKEFYERFGFNISLENITEALHENPLVEFMNNIMVLPGMNDIIHAFGVNQDGNNEDNVEGEAEGEAEGEGELGGDEEADGEAEGEGAEGGVQNNELPPLEPLNPGLQIIVNFGGQQIVHPFGNLLQLNNNLNNLMNNILQNPIVPNNNVVCTLQEEDFDKLKTFSTLVKLEEKCTICMTNMEEKEVICELPCKDKFHLECITPLLKNYSYHCPNCRKEVGKPKYNNL
jgi:hypothetical protein